jgi:hypothetical protein
MSPTFILPPSSTPTRIDFYNSENSISGFVGVEGNFQIHSIAVLTGRIGYN